MTSEIPVTQARDELADLINRVAYGRERIILTRHSKPVACIVPPEDLAWLERQGVEEKDGLSYSAVPSDSPQRTVTTGPMPAAAQYRAPGRPRC